MLCTRCKKKEATKIFIEMVNGKKVGYSYCDKCYAEMFGDLNSSLDSDVLDGILDQPKRKRVNVCPMCGMTYSEFERTGLLGCAVCYDVFKENLMPYIERIQGKVEHVGKVGQDAREQELTRKLSKLQEALEKAVREKRYPDAEKINAEIFEVRQRIAGGEGEGGKL